MSSGGGILELIGASDNFDETPGFFNYPGNILGVTITFMALTWIFTFLRLYTRFFVIRTPGWDDFFVVLSLLSTTAGSIAICLAVTHGGMGTHFLLLSESEIMSYLKIFYVANATYPGSAGYIKLALLFQYLRVYDKSSRLRKYIILTIIVVAIWCSIYSVLAWVPCIPVSAFSDYTVPATRYGFGSLYVDPFVATYTSLTSSNVVLDAIILGFAAPLLLYRKTSSKRWALVSLFFIGSIASIFSIWRLASIIHTRATTYPTFDPTWYGSTPIVLTALEVDIATISAALPVFWPVLRNFTMDQILVTREVKVTLEHRRLSTGGTTRASNDPEDDEAIELQRSQSGLQFQSHQKDHYDNPYVAQQVDPLSQREFGTKSQVGVTTTISRKSSIKGHRAL